MPLNYTPDRTRAAWWDTQWTWALSLHWVIKVILQSFLCIFHKEEVFSWKFFSDLQSWKKIEIPYFKSQKGLSCFNVYWMNRLKSSKSDVFLPVWRPPSKDLYRVLPQSNSIGYLCWRSGSATGHNVNMGCCFPSFCLPCATHCCIETWGFSLSNLLYTLRVSLIVILNR